MQGTAEADTHSSWKNRLAGGKRGRDGLSCCHVQGRHGGNQERWPRRRTGVGELETCFAGDETTLGKRMTVQSRGEGVKNVSRTATTSPF